MKLARWFNHIGIWAVFLRIVYALCSHFKNHLGITQLAHDVRTTSYGRCYDVKNVKTTSIQRRSNVVCRLGNNHDNRVKTRNSRRCWWHNLWIQWIQGGLINGASSFLSFWIPNLNFCKPPCEIINEINKRCGNYNFPMVIYIYPFYCAAKSKFNYINSTQNNWNLLRPGENI